MRTMSKKSSKTHYAVEKDGRGGGSSVFREVTMPNGEKARVMNKRVYDQALESANQKLIEAVRRQRDLAA